MACCYVLQAGLKWTSAGVTDMPHTPRQHGCQLSFDMLSSKPRLIVSSFWLKVRDLWPSFHLGTYTIVRLWMGLQNKNTIVEKEQHGLMGYSSIKLSYHLWKIQMKPITRHLIQLPPPPVWVLVDLHQAYLLSSRRSAVEPRQQPPTCFSSLKLLSVLWLKPPLFLQSRLF